jgi:hypothetical protein
MSDTSARSTHHWIETLATVLLALAAVATAWSSYQAARWGEETTKDTAAIINARLDATRALDLANAQKEVDVATFIEWANAYSKNDTFLEDFYYNRIRREFRAALDAWIATMPLTNPDAPRTPFEMQEYVLAAEVEADRQDAVADAKTSEVSRNLQHQSNYVLGVVLFATALFFSGISTRIAGRYQRLAILGMGCAVFIGGLAWLSTMPVSISV